MLGATTGHNEPTHTTGKTIAEDRGEASRFNSVKTISLVLLSCAIYTYLTVINFRELTC